MLSGHPLSEVLGSLSIATDLATGQAPEAAMGATTLAVRLARTMGLAEAELVDTYYSCVTRCIGWTATAMDLAPLVLGDDISLNHALNLSDPADPASVRTELGRHFAVGADPASRQAVIEQLVAILPQLPYAAVARCEQAVALTKRLPVPDTVASLLSHLESRWDGKNPTKKGGEEIPQVARVVEYAVIAELHRRAGGPRAMIDVGRARAGGQFDPAVVAAFEANAAALLDGFDAPSLWELFVAEEPGTPRRIAPSGLRAVAEPFADFVDTKSGWFLGHSRQVAALAARAAERLDWSDADKDVIVVASLLHDVGRVGVPNGIWDKPSGLTAHERRHVHSAARHTEDILSASPVFGDLVDLACSVQERCDGSGYHRHRKLSEARAGVIAVANVYDALTHDRPWRAAYSKSEAADRVIAEVDRGRLPREPAHAVLEAADRTDRRGERVYPDGLTRRDAEILVHIARGLATKEIAAKLFVATKTADTHIQKVYAKIGARSRTAAAMYAAERGLFEE